MIVWLTIETLENFQCRGKPHDKKKREVFTMRTADGKEIVIKYGFPEYSDMYQWLQNHKEYKMVDYKFTFQYGYILYYTEK